jgi:hypothetical protein
MSERLRGLYRTNSNIPPALGISVVIFVGQEGSPQGWWRAQLIEVNPCTLVAADGYYLRCRAFISDPFRAKESGEPEGDYEVLNEGQAIQRLLSENDALARENDTLRIQSSLARHNTRITAGQ